MITINNLEEMKRYYNKDTNTYVFTENGVRRNVEFTFDVKVNSHILAMDIDALWGINVGNIDAWDINVGNIDAKDITAYNIDAWNINANNISYYAACFANENIECTSIKGRHENSKHFSLFGEIIIKKEEPPTEMSVAEIEKLLGKKIKIVNKEM